MGSCPDTDIDPLSPVPRNSDDQDLIIQANFPGSLKK